MLEALYIIRDNIYFAWFALLIFFAGFCLSYLVDRFKIEFLLWFPHWFIRVISKHVNPKAGFIKIFLVIFLFNSVSIALYMSSGVFIIFPFIIALITGMNIGLTVFIPPHANIEGFNVRAPKSASKMLTMMLFSTIVLVLEVITFSVALGMGMSLATAVFSSGAYSIALPLFLSELLLMRLKAYLLICVPVLAVSAYLEARVIKGN